MTTISHKGLLLVIAAASGTGKSTVCQLLLEKMAQTKLSISYTTRSPRKNEKNGEHYHFVSTKTFQSMIENNELLEWAKVHDHYYGTGKQTTIDLLEQGYDVLLDIDIQGAYSIQEIFPDDAVTIFLLPPSWAVMLERLTNRGTETKEQINRRLKTALHELPQASKFDHIVVNDDLDETINIIKSITSSEKTRPHQMQQVLNNLLQQLPTE